MSACKTNALKRPEIGQRRRTERESEIEKDGEREHEYARPTRENINGYLRYSLCLKCMQNTYFGILDTRPGIRGGRGCVMARASIYKLHKSSRAHFSSPRPGNFAFAEFRIRMRDFARYFVGRQNRQLRKEREREGGATRMYARNSRENERKGEREREVNVTSAL